MMIDCPSMFVFAAGDRKAPILFWWSPHPSAVESTRTSLIGAVMAIPPRTVKSCSNPVALPISEGFTKSQTVVMFSPPFHAPKERSVAITVTAEMSDPSSNPALGTVGVSVHQCCDVIDSAISAQTVGHIGPTGSPESTEVTVQLKDDCSLTTHFDGTDECIYYLRLKIASSTESVILSYTVQ
ncbi:hypothetical protein ACH3Y9_14550 [Streptomyces sp. WSLK1-5]|uniref:hypothetical protein n=1 Tax=unclassified Streptomyces TaxID=2593676 RepID=UPI0037A7F949